MGWDSMGWSEVRGMKAETFEDGTSGGMGFSRGREMTSGGGGKRLQVEAGKDFRWRQDFRRRRTKLNRADQ